MLGEGPETVATLASSSGADANALGRVIRLLDSHGVFELRDGQVRHTEASRLLRSDHPRSMRDFARMFGLTLNWRSAERLHHSVATGESAASEAFAGGFWGRLEEQPDEARIFDGAMVGKSMGQIGAITANYDFSSFGHVVDVGGGQGHLIRAILQACPRTTGTLFDLPHVVEAASQGGDEGGRLSFVGGDFFKDPIPAGDGYILMEVIHDWDDEHASQIFKAVRTSASDQAKLLLIETEVPEGGEADWSKTLDIVMLTLFAARQRTAAEYEGLLRQQGFGIKQRSDTGAGITVFEAS